MHKNRVKIVLALTLTVAILICNTVSVFAYEPFVSIDSSEWDPIADTLTPYRYPNGIMIGDNEQEFKKFEELYGDTCYFSSDDTLIGIESVNISINPDAYKYDGFYIFEHNNTIYMYNFNPDDFTFCFDSNGRLKILAWNDDIRIFDDWSDIEFILDIYSSNYPYNSFKRGSTLKFVEDPSLFEDENNVYPFAVYNSYHTARYIYPSYCTEDVYGMQDDIDHNILDVIHEANLNVHDTVKLDLSLTTPLKMYSGKARFELTGAQIQRFKFGRYAFLFDNTGFINGYDSRFSYSLFQLQVFNKDLELLDNVTLFQQEYYDAIGFDSEHKEPLPAYQGVIDDYVVYWDNNLVDLSDDTYYCFIGFVFVCDTFAAFFPGDIEIVEFNSFEDDIEHDEILNSIGDASSSINNAVSDAAQDIVQGFEDSLQVIISGDTGVDRVVVDTSDMDNITVEQDAILNDIYADLNSDIQQYLPNGYDDPYDYLNDSISDFSSLNSTFAFIQEFYDRTVEATGMGAVILFVLSFGFATYAIGRRLS